MRYFLVLKKDQLEEFFNYAGLPYPGEKIKIDKQISILEEAFMYYGIQKLVERLRRKELLAINEQHTFQLRKNESESNNDKSAPVLRKRIHEEILEDGLHTFLRNLDKKTLTLFFEALELTGSGTEDHLRKVIENEARAIGLRNYVSKCDSLFLRDCIKSFGKKAVVNATRKSLVDAFIYQGNADEVTPQKDVEKIASHKPKIKKGVTGASLFQWYLISELIDYARDHDITPIHGKKKEIIERILDYLESREEGSKSPRKEKEEKEKEKSKKDKKDKKDKEESKEEKEEEKVKSKKDKKDKKDKKKSDD